MKTKFFKNIPILDISHITPYYISTNFSNSVIKSTIKSPSDLKYYTFYIRKYLKRETSWRFYNIYEQF